MKDRSDPYLKFLMSVPEEDEELTDRFQKELDRAWRDIDEGKCVNRLLNKLYIYPNKIYS